MIKEKLHIPMPDERTIQLEIDQIVAEGVQQQQSFPSYLKSMVQQVGFKHLFADRLELVYITCTALIACMMIFFQVGPERLDVHELYGFIFLLSPILFVSFSAYTYVSKVRNATFEIEMSCKYNVYQVIAFRMLVFSAISIVVNTIVIVLLVFLYEDIQFLRAFMISLTALFTFSILFLYGMMKRRSTVAVASILTGWIVGNLLLRFSNYSLYTQMLVALPLFIYGLVLGGTFYIYLKYLGKLIHFKQTEGAF
ncbi:hypothetical protein [Sporosarcina sp. FSL K6-3457]|uniref:hypothetical protein n=1 Tax=Sporosarcina sp. FSL K6-3457 TaxID=2978204 RepID=UPI0030F8C240